MNPLINFRPIRNYGQPDFGCSIEQNNWYNKKMCYFLNEQKQFERKMYNYHYNRNVPYHYVQPHPRLVTKALRVTVALNKGHNDWLQNIVNF